jgi:hypothetical protein
MASRTQYYGNDGRAVALTATDQVVVELELLGSPAEGLALLRERGTALTPSLTLVLEAYVAQALGPEERTVPGVHPVLRTDDGTLLAVLPEVRVEGDPDQLARLAAGPPRAEVAERDDGRLVLRPSSGRGADALALANALHESGAVTLAQPRFLRIVT